MLMAQAVHFDGVNARVNYGLDRVRFTGPVPVDSRIRIRAVLWDVTDEGEGAVKVAWVVTFELDGSSRPVCVAESLAKLYF